MSKMKFTDVKTGRRVGKMRGKDLAAKFNKYFAGLPQDHWNTGPVPPNEMLAVLGKVNGHDTVGFMNFTLNEVITGKHCGGGFMAECWLPLGE
jgi:hypothetical protein